MIPTPTVRPSGLQSWAFVKLAMLIVREKRLSAIHEGGPPLSLSNARNR